VVIPLVGLSDDGCRRRATVEQLGPDDYQFTLQPPYPPQHAQRRASLDMQQVRALRAMFAYVLLEVWKLAGIMPRSKLAVVILAC